MMNLNYVEDVGFITANALTTIAHAKVEQAYIDG